MTIRDTPIATVMTSDNFQKRHMPQIRDARASYLWAMIQFKIRKYGTVNDKHGNAWGRGYTQRDNTGYNSLAKTTHYQTGTLASVPEHPSLSDMPTCSTTRTAENKCPYVDKAFQREQ